MGEWISVKDRLPEDGSSVLVFIPDYPDAYLSNRVAWLDCDTTPPLWIHEGVDIDGVTHWQPLPAPPEANHDR
jgi:hypothetical protein